MPMIVSVHSYRGGTGKSNLTANLAVAAALAGRRVGIVDTDIQSPGIHVLFGLAERQLTRALNDYLWGRCAIEDAAYHITPDPIPAPGQIYLIPSSLKAGEIARVLREGYDVAKLQDGFERVLDALNLDCLLIDTHPGMNEETLLSIAVSDQVVLLMRPDQQDFLGTAVTVEVARKLGVPSMWLVLNKVLASVDADALRRDVEKSFNADVAAVLPLSEDLIRLGSSGLMLLRQPDHPWSRAVAALGAKLFGGPR